MDVPARLTTKGQLTVPKAVREQLELATGDEVVFRVESNRAVLSKTADFLELAGVVGVPPGKRGTPWDEVRGQTRASRVSART